jgi:uncharacterized protein with NRDE domain
MCLIFLSLNNHPTYKLILAGNRDEFYSRDTAPAHFWHDRPDVLAGRDLEAGGTWLGMSRQGNIAMVTNYRDPQRADPKAPSRGHLVSDFLMERESAQTYLEKISSNGKKYNGFNLIVGDAEQLWYYSNYKDGFEKLTSGFYGLSNHLLETSWPKVVRGKAKIEPILAQTEIDAEELFDVLYDQQQADLDKLPHTGLSPERERALSPMFIKTPGYGSRCSTVILINHKNEVLFSERDYDVNTFKHATQTFRFVIP